MLSRCELLLRSVRKPAFPATSRSTGLFICRFVHKKRPVTIEITDTTALNRRLLKLKKRMQNAATNQSKEAEKQSKESMEQIEEAIKQSKKAKQQSKSAKKQNEEAKKQSKEARERKDVANGQLGTNSDVLSTEIEGLVKGDRPERLPEQFSEIKLKIVKLSSTGDGLALADEESGSHVYIVPFSIPGDTVLAKVIRHFPLDRYSETDFLRIIHPSKDRDDSRIKCKYFSKCSGCQLQMMAYETQLQYKQRIMKDAYRNFSKLSPEKVPKVEPTHGSPLQYGYRTKLTPHFDSGPRKRTADGKQKWSEVPPIGFTIEGQKKTMDIEECPIGTEVLNKGLTAERQRVKREIDTYKQGATLLLRESTKRVKKPKSPVREPKGGVSDEADARHLSPNITPTARQHRKDELEHASGAATVSIDHPGHTDIKTCITSHNALATEYVSGHIFRSTAGSFFQNNNSILGPFTEYIRSLCTPLELTVSSSIPPDIAAKVGPPPAPRPKMNYLLDAYCGSGLFAISLCDLFRATLGIDIDERGIEAARRNAQLNRRRIEAPTFPLVTNHKEASKPKPPKEHSVGFIAADAARLFQDVPFPASETLVVIDPPRKGCSLDFLRQLRKFGPERIIYVSCNVHTQARDVGWLVRGEDDADVDGGTEKVETEDGRTEKGAKKAQVARYQIDELAPWDFFPQTGHVEGVAVLKRVKWSLD